MISIKSSYRSDTELAAFPDALINFYRLHNLSLGPAGIKILSNRPDLDHCVLAVEKQVPTEDMLTYYFDRFAYGDMNELFEMYTVIPAGNRRTLKRKMNGSTYFRYNYGHSLHNLKWVLAKYVFAVPGKVLFMQSPILLFDSSVSSYFIDCWFSAFASLLSTGNLECVVNHTHFCLGTFKLSPSELESKRLRM
jgi:hypothetical protein